jgi:sugar phosphate isomerase/epimerase
MLRSGLVSITFRKLSPGEIVDLVSGAGLECIEWGGDVHCPHGDLARAEEVARLTAAAGLRTSAYGSYYRLAEDNGFGFEAVVASARALGAATIRVWAGRRGSAQADADYRARVVEESRRCAELAAAAGMTLSYEFHSNTLTDTNQSARDLLDAVGHESVRCFWQPPNGRSTAYRLAGLRAVRPDLSNLHVFTWEDDNRRLPLADGEEGWATFLEEAAADSRDHDALIEFVVGDSPESFERDAQVLRSWLERVNALAAESGNSRT